MGSQDAYFSAAFLYACYSAFVGEWARATFFLVLWHIGFDVSKLIYQEFEKHKQAQ
jgi:hypothetical protein